MYLSQEATEIPSFMEDTAERPFHPQLLPLKRHCQFYEFLRKELPSSRTEAEKEVVRFALVMTKMQIRKLEREMGMLLESGR